MSYSVDPANPAEPTDDREAGMMAAEFRSIKGYLKNNLLKAITDNKTASDASLKSINDKLNVATGNADLPAAAGLIPVVAAIYNALYAETTGTFAKLNAVITKADQQAQQIQGLQEANNQLTTAFQQLSQSFTALNQKFNQLTSNVGNIKLEFPVGYVIVTKTAANPATYLGYGTWKAACEGKYLAGVGRSVYNNATGFNFTAAGVTYGYPYVQLAYNQIPPHRHTTNVLVRLSKTGGGQFLTKVNGEPTLGEGTQVIIGYHPQTNEPIYGSESSGARPGYYTRNYEGPVLNTWENHKDYGKDQQAVPYTGYAHGNGINSDGTSRNWEPTPINPTAVAYYMWERTA